MIYIKPDFYDNFKCKADKCTDTCCAGWEVDIDTETLEKYKNINGNFGKRLIGNIAFNADVASFVLKENDRCAFLCENGLCDIYSNLGEGFLCEICREHPRFYDFFDGITEMGIGLCCEKTCELLFESDLSLCFDSFSDGADDEEFDEEDSIYFKIRENCFDIIKNREVLLKNRIEQLCEYIVAVQNDCFGDCFKLKKLDEKQIIIDVVEIFEKTEPINAQWTEFISDVKNKLNLNCSCNINENNYERILTYIVYRHFMQSRFTGNVIAPVAFAVVSLVFICICDCISPCELINNVKLWSKQIEYSEFNTDYLLRKSLELFVI